MEKRNIKFYSTSMTIIYHGKEDKNMIFPLNQFCLNIPDLNGHLLRILFKIVVKRL